MAIKNDYYFFTEMFTTMGLNCTHMWDGKVSSTCIALMTEILLLSRKYDWNSNYIFKKNP